MKKLNSIFFLVGLFCFEFADKGFAQDSARVNLSYGDKGFKMATADENFSLYLRGRLQFRYANPFDGNPIYFEGLDQEARQVFKIRRARLKVGGNAYKPYLKYYFEYELGGSNLLDYRVMIEKWRGLNFKIGQWKVNYNRERVVSSGKQQLVDRSLINRYFTLDRQQGVSVYGNLGGPTIANFSYEFSVLTGAGRMAYANPTNDLMYMGHLQWNFLGREMPVSGSDIKRHARPVGELGVNAATFKGPYTYFSSSGGGVLLSWPDSVPPYFEVRQANVETAIMYRGFSWQNETHIKIIEDQIAGETTTLAGAYFQAGYFFHEAIAAFPENLEVAARYAVFSPDIDLHNNRNEEYSLAVNYFFAGHKNKLTAEYTTLVYHDPVLGRDQRGRFRIQWDISF